MIESIVPYRASWLPLETDNLLLPTKWRRNDAGAFSDLDLGKSGSFYFCHFRGYTTIPDTLMERKAQQILTSYSHHRWGSKDISEVNLNISVPVESVVDQSCPTLCDPMDYTLPGSSVHGILHARIREWIALPFSRGFSQPRDWTQVSCIAGRFFTVWATMLKQSQLSS